MAPSAKQEIKDNSEGLDSYSGQTIHRLLYPGHKSTGYVQVQWKSLGAFCFPSLSFSGCLAWLLHLDVDKGNPQHYGCLGSPCSGDTANSWINAVTSWLPSQSMAHSFPLGLAAPMQLPYKRLLGNRLFPWCLLYSKGWGPPDTMSLPQLAT